MIARAVLLAKSCPGQLAVVVFMYLYIQVDIVKKQCNSNLMKLMDELQRLELVCHRCRFHLLNTLLMHHKYTTTILWPFFQDHPGEPVPEENF